MKTSYLVLICAIWFLVVGGCSFLVPPTVLTPTESVKLTTTNIGIVSLTLSFGLGILSLIFSRKERLAEMV
jgi:hypothetical protein